MSVTMFLMPTVPPTAPAEEAANFFTVRPHVPSHSWLDQVWIPEGTLLPETSNEKMNWVNQILFLGYKNWETGN